MKKEKNPNSLVTKAHKLAFETEVPNKEIAKKLKLTDRQLRYVLYKLKPEQQEKFIVPTTKKYTITESFLDFFIADKFR